MASTNKSEKLGLSLWEETDKPERADFVSDNEIVEQLLGEHLSSSSLHLTETQKNFINNPIYYQYYLGNGEPYRDFKMPITNPGFIVVFADRLAPVVLDSEGHTLLYFGVATNISSYDIAFSKGIEVKSGGILRVWQYINPDSQNCLAYFNYRSIGYHIIYFGPKT